MAKLDLTLGAVGAHLHSLLAQSIAKAGVAAEKERARQRTLDYDPATVEVKIDGELLGFDGEYVANVQTGRFKGFKGSFTFTATVLRSVVFHEHGDTPHCHLVNSDGSLGPVNRKHT